MKRVLVMTGLLAISFLAAAGLLGDEAPVALVGSASAEGCLPAGVDVVCPNTACIKPQDIMGTLRCSQRRP